jgi:hypothetical protein
VRTIRLVTSALAFCLAGPATAQTTMEPGIDRFGADYRNYVGVANAPACQALCNNDAACRAYTFVEPGVVDQATHCFLKSQWAARSEKAGCTSGVKIGLRPDYAFNVTGIPFQSQEQPHWCWAATATMIVNRVYPGRLSQCGLAQQVTQPAGSAVRCCTDPAAASDPNRCDRGHDQTAIIQQHKLFDRWVDAGTVDGMEGEIMGTLRNGRPGVFNIKWYGGESYHVAVLYGMRRTGGVLFHSLFDPGRNIGHQVIRNGTFYFPNGYWQATLLTAKP